MTKTSSEDAKFRPVAFQLPGDPVPASRARIRTLKAKNGKTISSAYYAGRYKKYLDETPKAIPESPTFFDKGTPVEVQIIFFCKRPQKPANPYPKGDLDNYVKAILDAITKNGSYWDDDVQITNVRASKQYVRDQDPHTAVWIRRDA